VKKQSLLNADMHINLDLDNGVKMNYGKFRDLLAEVKAVCGKDEDYPRTTTHTKRGTKHATDITV
jgi:hypothetical protein